jgi:hypothetical protein
VNVVGGGGLMAFTEIAANSDMAKPIHQDLQKLYIFMAFKASLSIFITG